MQRALGADSEWTLANHLLAMVVDVLQLANWQRTGDKNQQRPKPIARPGVVDDAVRKLGSKPRTPAEIDEILAAARAREGG